MRRGTNGIYNTFPFFLTLPLLTYVYLLSLTRNCSDVDLTESEPAFVANTEPIPELNQTNASLVSQVTPQLPLANKANKVRSFSESAVSLSSTERSATQHTPL